MTGDGDNANDGNEEASKRQKNKNNLFQLTTLSLLICISSYNKMGINYGIPLFFLTHLMFFCLLARH